MKVYHASDRVIVKPDTLHSRSALDFGPGFYLTTLKEQAIKYAERFQRRKKDAWLNVYELNDDLTNYVVKHFDAYDEEWLDFVMNCRKNIVPEKCDVIFGGIANDKVFRTIDLFFSEEISKEEALKRLIYEKPNMQLCISSDSVLHECLTYIESIKL